MDAWQYSWIIGSSLGLAIWVWTAWRYWTKQERKQEQAARFKAGLELLGNTHILYGRRPLDIGSSVFTPTDELRRDVIEWAENGQGTDQLEVLLSKWRGCLPEKK